MTEPASRNSHFLLVFADHTFVFFVIQLQQLWKPKVFLDLYTASRRVSLGEGPASFQTSRATLLHHRDFRGSPSRHQGLFNGRLGPMQPITPHSGHRDPASAIIPPRRCHFCCILSCGGNHIGTRKVPVLIVPINILFRLLY